MEPLDKLNKDYFENVLPYLFKGAKTELITDFLSGQSLDKYTLKLDIRALFDCASDYKPSGNLFVHFTSFKAMHSILNECSIRMYNLKNVNDPNEFKLIASDFGYNKFSQELYKDQIYIFSMCSSEILKSDDILTLWKTFGDDGRGCVIEFEIDDLVENSSYIKLANIIYEKPDYSDFFHANSKFEERNKLKTDLKSLILIPACLHKNRFYYSEHEVRLFYEDGNADPINSFNKNSTYKYDFNFDHKIVSYHKVELYNERPGYPNIKIKRIQFGYRTNIKEFEKHKKHLELIYLGISKFRKEVSIPIIEISPLTENYT